MATSKRKLTLGLAVAALALGLTALMAGALPTAPPPHRQPLPPVESAAAAEDLAREQRELTYLRALRRQYLWGIDNLLVNQSFTRVELDRLKHEHRLMPDDDPARENLERRLRDLPDLYRDYAANEARVRELLDEVEAELSAREAALAARQGTATR
ncbi:MAG: hypothetical protein RIM84_18280 [Alphaproteobacteria bacterium]